MDKIDIPEPMGQSISREVFLKEIEAWANRIGVEPKEIYVRSMENRWSTCSSQGRVTFDSLLLREPAEFRKTVIVHELLHLKFPNHGRVFNGMHRAYLSDNQYV